VLKNELNTHKLLLNRCIFREKYKKEYKKKLIDFNREARCTRKPNHMNLKGLIELKIKTVAALAKLAYV
jgi:hypothetical protein